MTLGLPKLAWAVAIAGIFVCKAVPQQTSARYPILATAQDRCFGNDGTNIDCPPPGAPLSGQDAQHPGSLPALRDNGDGTVSELVSGLQWARAPSRPMPFADVGTYAAESRLGGHDDWRVPTIRELYSLIDFRGGFTGNPATSRPYIDTRFFVFAYGAGTGLGDAARGGRAIDVQLWSATRYVGRTMRRDETVFGINFADGRIKGYPIMDPANFMRTPNRLAVRLVRGPRYGRNQFEPEKTTVHDRATGLEWTRFDSGAARSWGEALAYCEALSLAQHRDWRLPNAKELQSIVDYTRIPAISPVFRISDAKAYLWSSTTHLEGPPPPSESARPFSRQGELAVYFAIGPALGRMEQPPGSGTYRWLDVHGAGAQRSDPKTAMPGQFPNGFGPQSDDIRGRNQVMCVRDDR
jgi:Protein of unknown function (DUF1566)